MKAKAILSGLLSAVIATTITAPLVSAAEMQTANTVQISPENETVTNIALQSPKKLQLARVEQSKKTTQLLVWNRISDADGYKIYGARCGESAKLLKTIQDGSVLSWERTGLKENQYYKYYVVSYKLVDGKRVRIARSAYVHATTTSKQYGNSEKLRIDSPTTVALDVGMSKNIEVCVTQQKSGKSHSTAVRYVSTNPTVASVNEKGEVTGKSNGNCRVYAYTQNGLWRAVTTTVSQGMVM